MSGLFLKILEMSLTGSFIIFGVILMRLISAIPRRYICALWLIAALRLLLPWLPESGMSMYDPGTLALPQTAFEQLQPPADTPVAPESAAPERSAPDIELICACVWLGGAACVAAYCAVA